MKNISKLARKRLWWSLTFNKLSGWIVSQNSRENAGAAVWFLIKLQAEVLCIIKLQAAGTTSISRFLKHFQFLLCRLQQNRSFLQYLGSTLFLIIGTSNCLYSDNIISNVRSCGYALREKSKINWQNDLSSKLSQ